MQVFRETWKTEQNLSKPGAKSSDFWAFCDTFDTETVQAHMKIYLAKSSPSLLAKINSQPSIAP